jgi:hypothetical protein
MCGDHDCGRKSRTSFACMDGAAGAIPMVDEATPSDAFENAIRRIGVVAACEWFGHAPDSEFTRDTIRELQQRSEGRPNVGAKAPT